MGDGCTVPVEEDWTVSLHRRTLLGCSGLSGVAVGIFDQGRELVGELGLLLLLMTGGEGRGGEGGEEDSYVFARPTRKI